MLLINFAQRSPEALEGSWGLLPDPMERGRRQAWWKSSRKPGEFFPSYDEDSFWPTEVPAVYNTEHPRLEFFEGLVIYRVHFPAKPAAAGERVFLSFEGVADRCIVFLNGEWVGEHDGPYTEFSCDVTKKLAEENRLMVYVHCDRKVDAVPGEIHDWFHFGGIHRPVRLYRVPTTFVQDAALETRLTDDTINLRLGVRLRGHSRDEAMPIHAELQDSAGHVAATWDFTAKPSIWTRQEIQIPRETARLWSPEDPALYRLVVTAGEDRWEDEVGLREVSTRGKELLLNGQPLFLRGVCTWAHDKKSGLFGVSAELAEKLVQIGKELNVNYFRAAHWPVSREYVKACNRAGILLWMEVPAYWMPNMADPAPMWRALNCAEEMLCASRNAPSVILWSVGNECVFHDTEAPQTNLPYFVRAAEFFHANDPTRLVTFTGGMEGAWSPHMEKICPQELVEQLDVIGINTYAGINDGATPGAREEVWDLRDSIQVASSLGKPVLLAENGIDAVLGEEGFDFGEERQKNYYQKVLSILEDLRLEGSIQGVSFFVLSDFRTPLKLSCHQNGFNRKGLLTTDFKPKKAFHVVAESFGKIKAQSS